MIIYIVIYYDTNAKRYDVGGVYLDKEKALQMVHWYEKVYHYEQLAYIKQFLI